MSEIPKLIEVVEAVEPWYIVFELVEHLTEAYKDFNYDPRQDADYWYKQIDKQLGIGDPFPVQHHPRA